MVQYLSALKSMQGYCARKCKKLWWWKIIVLKSLFLCFYRKVVHFINKKIQTKPLFTCQDQSGLCAQIHCSICLQIVRACAWTFTINHSDCAELIDWTFSLHLDLSSARLIANITAVKNWFQMRAGLLTQLDPLEKEKRVSKQRKQFAGNNREVSRQTKVLSRCKYTAFNANVEQAKCCTIQLWKCARFLFWLRLVAFRRPRGQKSRIMLIRAQI